MSREEILKKITDALPSAKRFINGNIDHRLAKLASKENTGGREARHHKKHAGFCLPYETRQVVAAENMQDELLKSEVSDTFLRKINEISQSIEAEFSPSDALKICFRTVELVFQKQGIEVSHFLESKEPDTPVQKVVSHLIDEAMVEFQVAPNNRAAIGQAAFYVLRKAFYQSEEPERLNFSKLSRTFCLLFTLEIILKLWNTLEECRSDLYCTWGQI